MPQEKFAFTVFERTFKEFGLPQLIRTDNGVPFASAHALYGLSKLAVWWLRLGIQIERIKPGHPQQDGRHERMPRHSWSHGHHVTFYIKHHSLFSSEQTHAVLVQ
jgi:transposase InsO family protein